MKGEKVKGRLGIPVTTALDWPTTLEGAEGLTTLAVGERGALEVLGLGALTRGGETPPAKMAEVVVDIPSPKLDITPYKGIPELRELNERTWTIT